MAWSAIGIVWRIATPLAVAQTRPTVSQPSVEERFYPAASEPLGPGAQPGQDDQDLHALAEVQEPALGDTKEP
jgi:hypothetical protein